MPYIDPRGYQRTHIGIGGAWQYAREGGLTQTGGGGDATSFQRAPSYRQEMVGDPREAMQDNRRVALYVAIAFAAAWWFARS